MFQSSMLASTCKDPLEVHLQSSNMEPPVTNRFESKLLKGGYIRDSIGDTKDYIRDTTGDTRSLD